MMVRSHRFPRARSQNIVIGSASAKTPLARLMTSDSVVDRLEEVCFTLHHDKGKYVFGPTRTRKFPEVDRALSESPAKSASAYNLRESALAGSPI